VFSLPNLWTYKQDPLVIPEWKSRESWS